MKKIGLQPGSLIYTGTIPKTVSIPIQHFIYTKETLEYSESIFNENFKISYDSEKQNWFIINGIHNIDVVKIFGNFFDIDSLVLEDLLNNSQRPKIECRNNFIFIPLKASYVLNEKIISEQISFVLFENTLLLFREFQNDIFSNVIERLKVKLKTKTTDFLTYNLFDTIVDLYFPILESLTIELNELEENIIQNPTKKDFEKIIYLKKRISSLKREINPLKEIIIRLKDSEFREYFHSDLAIFFKDLQDHIFLLNENIDSLYSNSNELLQLYHSTISTALNEVMKILTLISTIFIPLSFLASLYGMNFSYMPELSWHYGYFALLILMFFICIFTISYFKKKKWW